jgi:hypothetical protein
MRALVALLAVLAALTISASAARATETPGAELLLDLDLLREADPRLHREGGVARSVPLLEFLRRLEPPASARPDRGPKPPARESC